MRCFRVFLVVYITVICSLLDAAQASASPVCESSLPPNIDAGILEPNALALLHRSETFRQQCTRIAATRVLRVTLHIEMTIEGGGRAQTTITRYESGALRADVVLLFRGDPCELLAHEFEHIVEQVDGVNLRDEVAAKQAWLTASGAFETRRATDAGLRARREWDAALTAEAVQGDGRKAPGHAHQFH